jgi:hypothetical protein
MRRHADGGNAHAAEIALGANLARSCLFIATLLVAMPCRAFPEYPGIVQATLRLSAPPACTLCHTDPNGGQGTAQQKFALTLKQFGLTNMEDFKELETVLQDVDACNVDSDGDGVPDIVELQKGTNPNDGSGPPKSDCGDVKQVPSLQTGCAVASHGAGWGAALVVATLSLGALGRRRPRFSL